MDQEPLCPLYRELMVGIEVYVPPVRRHWARRLGRPIMSPFVLTANGFDDLGPVFVEELHGKNCLMSYKTHIDDCENVHTGCVPGVTREQVWRARLIDYTNGDEAFMKRWLIIYGQPWPMTRVGAHPVLADVYKQWLAFHERWLEHCWEREAWLLNV
jgi:hypothetical protein